MRRCPFCHQQLPSSSGYLWEIVMVTIALAIIAAMFVARFYNVLPMVIMP